MNNPRQPQPESRSAPAAAPQIGSGTPPQSALLSSHSTLSTPSSNPDADEYRIGLELERLEKTYSEPDYDDGYDEARERELLMDDLADDNDDFARSDEEGWYYSDED